MRVRISYIFLLYIIAILTACSSPKDTHDEETDNMNNNTSLTADREAMKDTAADSMETSEDKTEKLPEHSIANPIIWADVPDPDVIRVGDYYYMVSTTMHMTPGAPIMRSADMADWELVSYAYDVLEDDNIHNLINGNVYGRGSWAASIRYHEGFFYVCFGALETGKTYIFKTEDVENGIWERMELPSYCHDPSLFFDDGRVYIINGGGHIWIRELKKDLSGFKTGGVDQELVNAVIEGKSSGPEGSHMYKIGDYYYLFLIDWPGVETQRREWCFRSKTLFGEYEGKIVLDDNFGYGNSGVAQGGIFDTPEGNWYGIVFQDHGAVGRIPMLVPVNWEEDWPMMGVDGRVPETLDIKLKGVRHNIIASDEFDYAEDRLSLPWQFNHNPDNSLWSVTKRPGYLRLITGSVVSDILTARNTVTQRTMGPVFITDTKLETTGMKPGDYTGIAAFQYDYGMLGVTVSEDGTKAIILVTNDGEGKPLEQVSLPLEQDTVYLKIEYMFSLGSGRKISDLNKAYFKYSYDGEEWEKFDYALPMTYKLEHFVGYRSALFCYSTEEAGGYADFDYYHCKTLD